MNTCPLVAKWSSHFIELDSPMLVEDAAPRAHYMTYGEREVLKNFARRGEILAEMLIMIAHWMRCDMGVSFSAYAANWAVAQVNFETPAIQEQRPLTSPRMIADRFSTWGGYLK